MNLHRARGFIERPETENEMRLQLFGATILALAMASAAAAEPVRPGEQQGLGLTGPEVPPLLREARANPYALPASQDCPGVLAQISALDEVLGPDLDAPATTQARNGPDVMAGVRAILPYGGVMRMFTGAGRREKALTQAALAGWERRGFLKGVARNLGCEGFGPAVVRGEPAATVEPTGPR
ncbi:MAG: hypothetical protein JWP49_2346 [Phenylobacterium sp.]|nr:hypothetical protein [Phenylobacterium sp.]